MQVKSSNTLQLAALKIDYSILCVLKKEQNPDSRLKIKIFSYMHTDK